MRRAKHCALALAAGALTVLGGCQVLGPNSIDVGRGRYNSIIQSTSMEQTMSNIVRVYDYEPPMFMDVTEVDATVAFSGSMTGGSSNIGAKHGAPTSTATVAGQVGTAGGTLQYTETPTIRYQPLLGQPLVAQLVTPVSVDALGLLYDSNWGVAPLFDFSVQYMTLDPHAYYSAIDTVEELADGHSVELAAAPSYLPKPPPPQSDAQAGPASKKTSAGGADNDSLVIYLLPLPKSQDPDSNERTLRLWVRLFRFYYENQPPFALPANCATIGKTVSAPGLSLKEDVLKDWDVHIDQHVASLAAQKKTPQDALKCLPNFIELRVVPAPLIPKGAGASHTAADTIATHVPLMRTYSALGILKNAAQRPNPLIEFVTPEQYRKIRAEKWNDEVDELDYYTLLPENLDSVDCPNGGCDSKFPTTMKTPETETLDNEIENWLRAYDPQNPGASYPNGISVFEKPGDDMLSADSVKRNGRLGTLKRCMLVVVDDHLPSDPVYVSYTDGQRWYYIAKGDVVSEKNFQLLSLFMSMMAIPPSTQPLSPVINVGG